MSLPVSDGNRAIFARFQEEGLEEGEFYDSDVSEGELDDAIGELQAVNELASRPHEDRPRSSLPFHVIFVVDSSSSMATPDVNGQDRLSAVFDACSALVCQQQREETAQAGDCYTLISFDTSAQVWFKRQTAQEAKQSIQDVRHGLLPVVHATHFHAAFKKLAEVLGSGKKPAEDVRVIFLSDGAPHEGVRLGASGHDRNEAGDLTAGMLVESLETELLGSPSVCGIKQLLMYTVAFGSDVADFEEFLKPLSKRTGGEHYVSSLSNFDLCRAFGTIASSITTTRTSVSAAPVGGSPCQQRFDSTATGKSCERTCTITRLAQLRSQDKKAGISDYKQIPKCPYADVVVESMPFAWGGMRLVYNLQDTWNREKSSKKPLQMVAKRLIRKEHATFKDMLPFCLSTETAIMFRSNFLRELKRLDTDAQIFFVPCYLYSYNRPGAGASEKSYFVAEQYLEGDFVKFNSNNGYVNETHPSSELMQAFSHYTFVKSRGKLLVVDLQGAVDNNCLMLTDPQVLSRAKSKDRVFGAGDLGFDGMKAFFETHECGETCVAMKLLEKQKKFQQDMEFKRRQCVICLSSARSTCFRPCGHSLACEDCAVQMIARAEKCPLCRVVIDHFEKGKFTQTFVPQRAAARPKRAAAKPSAGYNQRLVAELGLPSEAVQEAERLVNQRAALEECRVERDWLGKTPLAYAAWQGRAEVAQYLLQQGAAVDAKDKDGETPLALAARLGEGRHSNSFRVKGL
ncbi:ak1 [Symbiodinium sp. KB8]|nr:ak1 [Symbiodinium sp. KB8]